MVHRNLVNLVTQDGTMQHIMLDLTMDSERFNLERQVHPHKLLDSTAVDQRIMMLFLYFPYTEKDLVDINRKVRR